MNKNVDKFLELFIITQRFNRSLLSRSGNAKAHIPRAPRTFYAGRILWPVPHIRWPAGPRTGPFFFFFYFVIFFMIKLSMFKNWETLRSSQN